MRYPKVYIQIPHYHNASFLEECIRSCERLNYPQLDIHVFDDSSTDHSSDVFSKWSHSQMVFHRNHVRLGRVGNYQFAFSHHGSAEWMANLDSDDYYTDENWVRDAMSIVSEHPEMNILHVQADLLTYISISENQKIKDFGNGFCLISGHDYIQICIEKYCFSHLGSLFYIPLLERYGAYVDDCMHTDFITAIRIAIHGNVLVGNRHVGEWRRHADNQSSKRYTAIESQKNEASYYRFFEYCEDFVSYQTLKKWIKTYENREKQHAISVMVEQGNWRELFQMLFRESPFQLKLWYIILRSFLIKNHLDISFIKESLPHVTIGIVTKLISIVVSFGSIPYILQLLGLENYSWIGFYTTLVGAVYIFDFGLTNIISKEIVQTKSDDTFSLQNKISTIEVIYYGIGFFIFLGLFLSSPRIAEYWIRDSHLNLEDKTAVIRLISLAVFFQWPHSVYSSILFGLRRQHFSNVAFFVLNLMKNLGAIAVLTYLSRDIMTYFYWQVIVSILLLGLLRYRMLKEIGVYNVISDFSSRYVKEIRKFAIGISVISIFCFVYNDINNILLAKWLSSAHFGLYSILLTIVSAYGMVSVSIKNSVFPHISSIVFKGDKSDISKSYLQYSAMFSFIFIPISVCASINSHFLFGYWIQDKLILEGIQPSFPWIILGSMFNCMMMIPWSYLFARGQTKFLLVITGVLAVVSLPVLYFLVQVYGLLGASMYWFFINFIPFIVMRLYVDFQILQEVISSWLYAIVLPLVLSIFIYTGFYFLNSTFHFQLSFALIICLLLTGMLYGILFRYSYTQIFSK